MGIKIRDLCFSYGKAPILRSISIDIKDGEFVGMVGPTGSGKTTLAMCLNGLIPRMVKGSFSGSVEVSGRDTVRTEVFEMARSIGLVFQDPDSQIFSLSVEDEISFGLENMGLPDDRIRMHAERAMESLCIKDIRDKDTFALSLGQKQKVCIASVVSMGPEILVLDEPTSQLDFRGTKEVYDILRDLNRKGKTVIVIEHKTDWLLRYADRIIALDRGRVFLDGKPGEVLRDRSMEKIGVEIPEVFRIEKLLKKAGLDFPAEKMAGD